jgi:hypothetical protein
MYIRWIVRHHKNAETANVSFYDAYLVESYRDDAGQPRQRTIGYLGNIRQINGEFSALEREIFFIRAERIMMGIPAIDATERASINTLIRQKIPDLTAPEVERAFRNNIRWYQRWRAQRGETLTAQELADLLAETTDDPGADYEGM